MPAVRALRSGKGGPVRTLSLPSCFSSPRIGLVMCAQWAGLLVSLCLLELFAPGIKELCSQPMPDPGDILLSCGFKALHLGGTGGFHSSLRPNCVCLSSFIRGLFLLAVMGYKVAINKSRLEFLVCLCWLAGQPAGKKGRHQRSVSNPAPDR